MTADADTTATEGLPEMIVIDDLAEPNLTPAQEGVIAYAHGLDLSFEAGHLLTEAREQTGLADFGDDEFVDRLQVQTAAVESDSGLNGLGRMIVHRRFVRLLSSRLLFTDLLKRYPEIHGIDVPAPLIVVGLPRSGTTHLVNLLAADSRLRSLPFWESNEPFPRRGEGPAADGIDPRHARCAADYEAQMMLAPYVKAMHHQYPEAIEEEIELQDLDFASYTLEWHARVPAWRDYYFELDQHSSYEYLRLVLKALTFLRGPQRWVLKSPQHLEQLGPLTAAFPDATVAFCHRDPVAVIQSAVTMLAYGDRIRRDAIEPDLLVAYWIDRIETLLRACVRDRELVPAERSIDVLFHEFMADDIAMVRRIYEHSDLDCGDRTLRELENYMQANPRGKHGRVRYDLAGDFGVDPAELRERFGFYFDRFDVHAD